MYISKQTNANKKRLPGLFLELHESGDQFRQKLHPLRTTMVSPWGPAALGTAGALLIKPNPPVTDRTHRLQHRRPETVDASA